MHSERVGSERRNEVQNYCDKKLSDDHQQHHVAVVVEVGPNLHQIVNGGNLCVLRNDGNVETVESSEDEERLQIRIQIFLRTESEVRKLEQTEQF